MFAVEIYPPLKDKIKLPISKLRDNVVNTSGQGRLVLYKNNNKKYISTCNQYNQARQQFYVAKDSYNSSINSFFIMWCGSLNWLEKAKPAKISYLQNYNLQLEFAKLPSSLLYNPFGNDLLQVSTLIEKYPDATLIDIKPHTIMIESKQSKLRIVVNLLGKADFNDNGKQELLLSIAEYATDGNYHQYGIYVLSKINKQAKLKLVQF